MDNRIDAWNERFAKAPAEEVVEFFNSEFGQEICLSSSMGAEDQVLTHMLMKVNPSFRIFTLDTGRLFPETLDLIQKTRDHYNTSIEVFFPDYRMVQQMVREKGINLFYASVEDRKYCCNVRKMEPLKRALSGMKAWMTGIRKDQTINRFNTQVVEWDEANAIVKINPLYRWSEKMVWEYIRSNQIPYNELHDRNFPSIGCQPCTRAVTPGEDTRAGRWWWEDQGHKECGLHIK
ncbi:MAG TPA: phosphoadenylyl-sulfate reductase [Bacteroidales bacterium]|nr:phosphoadenylyl-sulfate reductase [Bacteroidales bacterium]